MSECAPVVLFVYNRPYQTIKTLLNLKKNNLAKKTNIIIFSDGYKLGDPLDKKKVETVRYIINNFKGFKKKKIYYNKKNLGLFHNITNGISKVFLKYEKVIILEDDILVNRFFLKYMNRALNLYFNDGRVSCINGWFPNHNKKIKDTFFLKGADIWGWATWKRAWYKLDIKNSDILKKFLKNNFLIKDFNLNNSYNYYDLLIKTLKKNKPSWGVLWMAHNYINNKYYLNFSSSLCINIGQDNSGENVSGSESYFNQKLNNKKIRIFKQKVNEDYHAKLIKINFFQKSYPKKNILYLIIEKFKKNILQIFTYYKSRIFYFGPYKTWSDTTNLKKAGYNNIELFKSILKNTYIAKNNPYYGERDGILIKKNFINHEILYYLTYIILKKKRGISILDFGGSLASQYFKIKEIIDLKYKNLWNVVEQPGLVKIGKKNFQNKYLRFYKDLNHFKNKKIDVIILSGSIQYLEFPFKKISELLNLFPEYVFFDRTPFVFNNNKDEIYIQKKENVSYPSWLFSYLKFKKMIKRFNYEIISKNQSEFDNDIFIGNKKINYLGYLFKKK